MKKLVLIALCILLLAASAIPAMAAGTTSFSMSTPDSTLHRGDTVTFTVSVSSSEPATSYGLMLSYDSSVFELVNGTTAVSGALVNSFHNGFAFMFQSPTAYSGTVGTVTLRVKDTASYGNFTVSGSASVKNGSTAISASGCSKTITVACNHNYGAWTTASNGNHQRTCSICGNIDTAAHTWNNGTVTKQSTCKEAGIKVITCTACTATQIADIAKTSNHNYGSWIYANDTQHKHICSVCQKEESANHIWDSGTITKQPTCKETGIKTYTCTGCNQKKTETVAKATSHNYGSWAKVSNTQHKHICSVCQKEESANHTWNSGAVTKTATCKEEGVKTYTCSSCNATKTEAVAKLTTHTYDHACDTGCNVCGTARTTTHNYKNTWSKDKNNHWKECSVCGDKKASAAHTPGADATESTAQTCTICGYVLKLALGHTHNYANKWTIDQEGHWYSCSGCEEKDSYATHDFENACDPDCSICGHIRETVHTFPENDKNDAENHWQECSNCGEKTGITAHEPGTTATAMTTQTCTSAPAPGITETAQTEATTGETNVTVPADNANDNNKNNGAFLWTVIIFAVVIIGGAVIFVVVKKKL